jgi:hypothetical protein
VAFTAGTNGRQFRRNLPVLAARRDLIVRLFFDKTSIIDRNMTTFVGPEPESLMMSSELKSNQAIFERVAEKLLGGRDQDVW